jgi:hypothetical protein
LQLERLRHEDNTAVQLGITDEEHVRRKAISAERVVRIQNALATKEVEDERQRSVRVCVRVLCVYCCVLLSSPCLLSYSCTRR